MSREALEQAKISKFLAQAGGSDTGQRVGTVNGIHDDASGGPIYGSSGKDIIFDNGGADEIFARGGDDWMVSGGTEVDIYHGGEGFDFIVYTGATTGVTVDLNHRAAGDIHATDRVGSTFAAGDLYDGVEGVVGSNQADNIQGLYGTAGEIYGFGGNDVIKGGGLADVIHGGAGRDIIMGGGGDDQLWGGADADVFIFNASYRPMPVANGDDRYIISFGNDVIHDWQPEFTNETLTFNTPDGYDNLIVTQSGADTLFTVEGIEGSVRVLNTTMADFAL